MALRTNIKNIAHMVSTARMMARFDCLFLLDIIGTPAFLAKPAKLFARKKHNHLRRGQRLALAFQALGPSYIKLGQQLSTRSDLLEEDICDDLRVLQDNVPSFSADIVRKTIETEFQKPLEQIYSSFDFTPVAAASVAQVHFAITTEGEEVAVKILRPNVEEQLEKTFDFFAWLAALVEKRKPEYRRYKLIEAVELIRRTTQMEVNFLNEGASCMQFAENFKDDDSFKVPSIDWNRSSEKVLTMERIHGIPLSDIEAIRAANIDVDLVMQNASRAIFKQAFEFGFFHADLHPGNIFVHQDGSITAVDFGIVGYIDPHFRRLVARFLAAVLDHDWIEAAKLHVSIGVMDKDQPIEELARVMAGVAWPIMDRPQSEISAGRLIMRMTRATNLFDMQAEPKLLLLEKALIAIEGSGRFLNPDVNIWYHARANIKGWMIDNLGPKGQIKHLSETISNEARRVPRILEKLEHHLDSQKQSLTSQKQHKKASSMSFILGIITGGILSYVGYLTYHML